MFILILITSLIGVTTVAQHPCQRGVCVPVRLCVNNTLLSGGEGLLDVR